MARLTTFPFSIRQLQYVLAIADTGGFGRAAEAAAVSQPALSAQVAKLEEAWGVRLFERLPGGIRLTEAGRALLPRIRRLVQLAAELDAEATVAADPEVVVLRIGMIPTLAPYVLPRAYAALRERLPRLTVQWMEARTADLETMLVRGEVDLAVIADPPRRPGIEHAALGAEPFVLLVPEDHPLHEAPVPAGALLSGDVLLLEEGHCLRDHALDLCVQHGADVASFCATSLPTLVQMVGAGMGITLLPASAVSLEVPRDTDGHGRRAPVRVLPLSEPMTRTPRLIWPARELRTALVAAVEEAFVEAIEGSIAAGA